MKVFGWIQSKLRNGSKNDDIINHKPNSMFEAMAEQGKEEVDDWLHGLLAIGTFGKFDIAAQSAERTGSTHVGVEQNTKDYLSEEIETMQHDLNSAIEAQRARQSRRKDVCVDNRRTEIGQKSVTFLFKKIFVCRGGFSVPPSPKASLTESTTEKIFRAMLHKKIYPQSSAPSMSAKKYLNIPKAATSNSGEYDGAIDKATKGSKWVKTDSEYIVLEI